jgi:hypothetical protein
MTAAQEKKIQQCAVAVWEYIGNDIFDVEGVGDSIPRSEVVELVIDAGRLEEQIRLTDPALATEFGALDYKRKAVLVKPAFRYERYGR